jgi:hypothetical protein
MATWFPSPFQWPSFFGQLVHTLIVIKWPKYDCLCENEIKKEYGLLKNGDLILLIILMAMIFGHN